MDGDCQSGKKARNTYGKSADIEFPRITSYNVCYTKLLRDFATVPLFGLYGESSGSPEPGFVHIEDVASRSRALDWRIEAHRHAHLFQVLSIHDGFSEVRFDDTVCSLTNGAVIAIPPGVVHSFRFALV